MKILLEPARSTWAGLTERNIPGDEQIERRVEKILDEVRREGDEALRRGALEIDGVRLEELELSEEEKGRACAEVSDELKKALDEAASNIRAFHEAQRRDTVVVEPGKGIHLEQRSIPIENVGLYIPGGNAPLFSTVLMLSIPAQIAGCKEVILCSPCRKDGRIAPEVVYAAQLCGVTRIFRLGGAGAIAAMAYGTESVPRVDKIFGPGNRYVTKAKQLVSRQVAIDMPAGPSEVLVMADESCRPEFVAADMLSQAEHGPDSQALALCSSEALALEVAAEVEKQTLRLRRQESVEKSLSKSHIIVFADRSEMISFANLYAPEHLIISLKEPWEAAGKITAAGSVFIGNYSPESAGDYASGPNHTLPTSGWARSYNGVNLDSFMRKITYQELSEEALGRLRHTITCMANAEGLDAHARAVEVRMRR